jgi:hypothetical protein
MWITATGWPWGYGLAKLKAQMRARSPRRVLRENVIAVLHKRVPVNGLPATNVFAFMKAHPDWAALVIGIEASGAAP